MTARRRRLLAFSLGLLLALGALAVLELLVRLAGLPAPPEPRRFLPEWVRGNIERAEFLPDALLFWRPAADHPGLGTNSRGFRTPEFPARKPAALQRVICLGDSCTWGYGVHADQAYPRVLQELLNRHPRSRVWEVINMGVPGYSSLQGRRLLESEALPLQPDVVTLYFGRNDRRLVRAEGYVPDSQARIIPPWLQSLRALLGRLRSFQILRAAMARLHKPSGHPPDEDVPRVAPEEFRENIRVMIRAIRRHGARPLLVTSPVFPDTVGNYNDLLRVIAARERVILVDAAARFRTLPPRSVLLDDCHPTPAGHRLLAQLIATALASPPPAGPPSPLPTADN